MTFQEIIGLSPEDKARLIELIPHLPHDQAMRLYRMGEAYKAAQSRESKQGNFLEFVKAMWPAYIHGRHFAIMANAFERIAEGKLKRLVINMAPRHGKSMFSSYLLPAWFLGRYPNKKIIQASSTADLAVGFGRQVRNLVDSEEYQKVFPGVSLAKDSKAAGRWNTNRGGEYFAIGTGGSVTGKGSDLLILDDATDEQHAIQAESDPTVYEKVFSWYTSGPRQRLQPNGAIILIATRWAKNDLPGRILQAAINRESRDEWEVIEFPAILPSGRSLWPEFWSIDQLLAIKNELPLHKWLAQFQQTPTSEEGALVKREWWRIWEAGEPPQCEYIIQSWDTAFSKGTRADYSACTTWGVFYQKSETEADEHGRALKIPAIICLNAFKTKVDFPSLKQRAKLEYGKWQPDTVLVEAKGAGQPLIDELRAVGVPAIAYTPARGNDKFVRVNAVADLFQTGVVWAPPLMWAEELIEEIAAFPHGDNDDLVDSTTQALIRFRKGGFIPIPSDEADKKSAPPVRADYY